MVKFPEKHLTQCIFSIVASFFLRSFKVHPQRIASKKTLCFQSWGPSVQKDVPSLQNYVQTNCPSVVPIVPLFKSNFANKGYCLLEASSLSVAIQTLYTNSHFFCSLLSMLVCIISRGYTQCDFCGPDLLPFKKIFTCTHDTFLVPNESHENHWTDSEK